VLIPPLSSPEATARAAREEVAAPTLNDLRAAVDALKKPRLPDTVEPQPEPASHVPEVKTHEDEQTASG
jgi:hypothetical protein